MDGSLVVAIASAAGGAFIGVVVRHFVQNPIREIAFSLPWLRVKVGSLSGYWLAEYRFNECGRDDQPQLVAGVYELIEWPGSIILIRDVLIAGEPGAIVIKAKRRDAYLTGTYENAAETDMLHGVFQLWIHPRGRRMHGRFLGFSADRPNEFNSGEWHWRRVTTDRTPLSLREARAALDSAADGGSSSVWAS